MSFQRFFVQRTQERKLSTPDLRYDDTYKSLHWCTHNNFVYGFAARSKEISGPYPIVLSPASLATPSPTFTPKSGQSDQQVQFTNRFNVISWRQFIPMQETTDTEENIDSLADMLVYPTAGVAESKGDEVNIIDDKLGGVEQRELQDLTDSGASLCTL